MPLRNFMTQTASTTRHPAMSSGKIGTPTSNLTNLKITPLMLMDTRSALSLQQAIGMDGTLGQIWETYTESHAHTDSGVSVTQLPDIREGDKLVVDGVTYHVQWANRQPATSSYGATLIIYVYQDKRG
jgi:hypothetical protein